MKQFGILVFLMTVSGIGESQEDPTNIVIECGHPNRVWVFLRYNHESKFHLKAYTNGEIIIERSGEEIEIDSELPITADSGRVLFDRDGLFEFHSYTAGRLKFGSSQFGFTCGFINLDPILAR